MSKGQVDWGTALSMLVVGALGIALLNAMATNPRISPLWRKIAQTAEGDLFQHIVTGEFALLA